MGDVQVIGNSTEQDVYMLGCIFPCPAPFPGRNCQHLGRRVECAFNESKGKFNAQGCTFFSKNRDTVTYKQVSMRFARTYADALASVQCSTHSPVAKNEVAFFHSVGHYNRNAPQAWSAAVLDVDPDVMA